MNKKQMRKELAALSPTEKIKLLEKLRDRSLSLARTGFRKDTTSRPADTSVTLSVYAQSSEFQLLAPIIRSNQQNFSEQGP